MKGMTAIQCKSGKTFAGSVTKYRDAEWKLQEAYYKAQGCKVVEVDSVTWEGCECEHCEGLEHKFEELIEEIKES